MDKNKKREKRGKGNCHPFITRENMNLNFKLFCRVLGEYTFSKVCQSQLSDLEIVNLVELNGLETLRHLRVQIELSR